MMFINEFLNKDLVIFSEESPLILLHRNYNVSMDNNGKDKNHTRQIYIRVNFFRRGKNCKIKILTGVNFYPYHYYPY